MLLHVEETASVEPSVLYVQTYYTYSCKLLYLMRDHKIIDIWIMRDHKIIDIWWGISIFC